MIRVGCKVQGYFSVKRIIRGMEIHKADWYDGIVEFIIPATDKYAFVGVRCCDPKVECRELLVHRVKLDEVDYSKKFRDEEVSRAYD